MSDLFDSRHRPIHPDLNDFEKGGLCHVKGKEIGIYRNLLLPIFKTLALS